MLPSLKEEEILLGTKGATATPTLVGPDSDSATVQHITFK